MNRAKILLVDPNTDHAEILKRAILNMDKDNFIAELTHITDPAKLISSLKEDDYELIISEYLFDGYSVSYIFNELKKQQIEVPVIFLTQDTSEKTAIEAFRNGAKDFFIKDFSQSNISKLTNAIKRLISEYRSIKDRKRMELLLQKNYNQMMNIFNTLEERIFIIDRDYNVLFTNDIPVKMFRHSESVKCYNAFFNNNEVCTGCIAKDLFRQNSNNISVKREIFDPEGQVWYRVISKLIYWYNEIPALLCILIDITDLKRKTQNLNNRLKYENAISTISSKAMMIKDLDHFLNSALEILGKTTGVSRVYIFKNYDNNRRTLNTHEWTKKGIKSFIGLDADYSDFPYWYNVLSNDGIIIASDIHDLPPEVHEILEMQNIISILVVPIFVKGQFFGFIGFDECERERKWEDYEINLLKVTAQIIGFRMSYDSKLTADYFDNNRQNQI